MNKGQLSGKPFCKWLRFQHHGEKPLLLPSIYSSINASLLPSPFFHTCIHPSVHLISHPTITSLCPSSRTQYDVYVRADISLRADVLLLQQRLYNRSGFSYNCSPKLMRFIGTLVLFYYDRVHIFFLLKEYNYSTIVVAVATLGDACNVNRVYRKLKQDPKMESFEPYNE